MPSYTLCAHVMHAHTQTPASERLSSMAYLEHFVGAGLNARGHVAWVKSHLLNFSKIINWVSV